MPQLSLMKRSVPLVSVVIRAVKDEVKDAAWRIRAAQGDWSSRLMHRDAHGQCAEPDTCSHTPAGSAAPMHPARDAHSMLQAAEHSDGSSCPVPSDWHIVAQPIAANWRYSSPVGHRCSSFASGPTTCRAQTPTGVQRGYAVAATSDDPARKVVAVGISGGVDSAVAAMLLKQQGHEVIGVFMRNWDEGEEVGNDNCSVERDLRDAHKVARCLGIPLHEADFVSTYWNKVFQEFVLECARGLTPNPDLACNRHIKFDALLTYASSLGADLVATGHYARLNHSTPDGTPQLLRGLDRTKDQSYFLASVPASALARVRFPVGHLTKRRVRQLAVDAGLPPADKRSSAGICFIGKRNFGDFIAQYTPPVPARYRDIDSGRDLGLCANLAAVTHGQRAGIGGLLDRAYIAGKDIPGRVVWVAQGRDHPALFTSAARVRAPHWLAGAPPSPLAERQILTCEFKARYGQTARSCVMKPLPASTDADPAGPLELSGATSQEAFQPSRFCRLLQEDNDLGDGDDLTVHFHNPEFAITPQQAFVMYDGDVVLGSAPIRSPGASLHEQGVPLPSDTVRDKQQAA